MTFLEHELAKLGNDRLRELARHKLPGLAAAAKAELDSRPKPPVDKLREAVFPPNPNR